MRINIKGDAVTPEKIAEALKICERDHKLKIKDAVIFVRWEDPLGRTVEPLQDGHEVSRDFYFRVPKQALIIQALAQERPEPKDPISAKEMMKLVQKAAHRLLSAPEMSAIIAWEKEFKPDKNSFIRALDFSLKQVGRLDIKHLAQTISKEPYRG